MMNYPTPQRVWHRCGERDGLPDFSETLRRETAAAVQVQDFGDDTFLWMIQFYWPTTTPQQDAIAAELEDLDPDTKWQREDLPSSAVEPIVGKDGKIQIPTQATAMSVQSLKAQASRYRFVGEELDEESRELLAAMQVEVGDPLEPIGAVEEPVDMKPARLK